jgi:predicted ester cyclase
MTGTSGVVLADANRQSAGMIPAIPADVRQVDYRSAHGVPIHDNWNGMLSGLDTGPPSNRLERIRAYYTCFNERRFADAAAFFANDAVVEMVPFQSRERGGAAYQRFANIWASAFPDAIVSVDEVTDRSRGVFEVALTVTGTHAGDLAMGGCVFRPTGVRTVLRVRELLEFKDDLIAVACLSFDLQELAHQLARVDDTQLLMHLSRLRYLEERLRSAPAESDRRHDVLDAIGRELDAARHVVRPYFSR